MSLYFFSHDAREEIPDSLMWPMPDERELSLSISSAMPEPEPSRGPLYQSHEHPPGSSSSPSRAMGLMYDVFIIHLGVDANAGFVSHLYEVLKSAGLNSFLAEKSLAKGEDALGSVDAVDAALAEARVHVVVVSEGYTDSKYGYHDLVAMMKSNKPVIPVLWDVTPEEFYSRQLRMAVYNKALQEGMSERETIEWSDAHQRLSLFNALHLGNYNGDEEKLTRNVVDVVLNNLKSPPPQLEGEGIMLMERILEAYPTIKDVGIDEATQPAQDHCTTIVLGFLNTVNDSLIFYFENGENMARIVGVGLQYGKVVVEPGFCIEAAEIEKEEWEKIWFDVRVGLDPTIKVFKVTLPTAARAQVHENRQLVDPSHLATVSSSNDGIFQEHASGVSNSQVQVPFLCELTKYFIISKVVDEFYVKRDVQTLGESSEVQPIQEDHGGQSRTGGTTQGRSGNGTVANWRETLNNLFSNLRVDPQSNQEKQGGSGDGGDGGNDDGDGGDDDGDGGDDDGGGDGRDGQDKATSVSCKQKLITTKVSITLLSGGDFFDKERKPLSEELEQSRLENVVIQPHLTLDFRKTIQSEEIIKEVLCTVGSVFFCLHRNCDYFESCGRFGWFHDELCVSFGPKSEDETEVSLMEETADEDYMDGKTTNKASSSKETGDSYERGGRGKVVLGNNHVGRIEGGGDIRKGTRDSNCQSDERSLESSCKQTQGGFYILPTRMPQKAKVEYSYIAPSRKVIAEDIKDLSYRDMLRTSPLCREQSVKYLCAWNVHGNADGLRYNFKAVRLLREITTIEEESECSSSTSMPSNFLKKLKSKKSEESRKRKKEVTTQIQEFAPVVQMYEKDILINLAMTHLVDGDTFKLYQRPNSRQPNWRGNDPLVQGI